MPFNNSLPRFDSYRITIPPGHSYSQLLMPMWKLRKRYLLLIISTIFVILPTCLGHDKHGRTLIQVCAALPDKWPVIDWLLKQKKVDINPKNLESGYTVRHLRGLSSQLLTFPSVFQALHYSVFYGRIDNAVNLIKVLLRFWSSIDSRHFQAGANTNLFDHDHMTYLDHVVRDTYIQTPSEQLDIGNDAD